MRSLLKTNPYLIILVFAPLYFWGLARVPVHLNQDEMTFAMNGYSIAHSLKDLNGRTLPFYFFGLGAFWFTPVVTYLAALVLRVFPLSEATLRIASVLVGLATIFLLTRIVAKLFENKRIVMVTGVLAATTPLLFIHSRLLLDNLYTVPFVLLWLLALVNKKYFWAGLALGVGIHSYHGAKVMMPLYLVASLVYLFISQREKYRKILSMTFAFLLPVIAFIPWFIKHPGTLTSQVSYASRFGGGLQINPLAFATRFVSYFNPNILFSVGDSSLIHSTGTVGALLFPMAFFLVFGVMQIIAREKEELSKLILFGLLTFPVASAIVDQPQRISRSLVVIPFAVLVAAYGVKFLLFQKDKIFKLLLSALMVISVLQFAVFLDDYFGNYRARSWFWFNGDVVGAYQKAITIADRENADRIYIDSNIYFAQNYFDFVETKLGVDLATKRKFFDSHSQDFNEFDPGSVIVTNKMVETTNFKIVDSTVEPDSSTSFYIYLR